MEIVATEFFIDVPSLPKEEFKNYTTNLFDVWDAYIDARLALDDYSIELFVEEGSIKGIARIGTAVGVIYAAICGYGSFVQGIEIIGSQAKAVGDYLATHASSSFKAEGYPVKSRSSAGAITGIRTLFVKVQSGKISVDAAVTEAERLLGEEAATNLSFMDDLRVALHDAPKIPEQIDFSESHEDAFEDPTKVKTNKSKRPSKAPKPQPKPVPIQSFRVEVRRRSKNESKTVNVVEL